MSFFREVASVLGLDEAKLALGYNYINYNGDAVYIEGIKSVLEVSSDAMAFRLPKGVLYVEGKSLEISELSGASVLVQGEIVSVGTERKTAAAEKSDKATADGEKR